MREKKLNQLAANVNYATAPFAGTPTKIAPPSQHITDGKVPGLSFAGQWQNFIDYWIHRQLERSAQLPFQNWTDVSSTIPATTSTPRLAYMRNAGMTLCANGVNNSVKFFQSFLDPQAGAVPLGITLAPSIGTFVPKSVIAYDVNNGGFFVGGSNSGATTKTLWKILPNGASAELAPPLAGSIENLTIDPETNEIYGFVADANRSTLKIDGATGGATSVGNRTGSTYQPAVATTFAAAGNGKLLIASNASTFVVWDWTNTNTISWNLNAHSGAADTSTVLDARYSVALGLFMILTTNKLITFADPGSAVTTYPHVGLTGGAVTIEGGCLTDTGFFGYDDGDNGYALMMPYVGDPISYLKYGGLGDTTGVFARYDGSAIWFMTDRSGTKKLFRSLRSFI